MSHFETRPSDGSNHCANQNVCGADFPVSTHYPMKYLNKHRRSEQLTFVSWYMCIHTYDWLPCLLKWKRLCVCWLPLGDIITSTAHTDCYHKPLPVYSPRLSFFQSSGKCWVEGIQCRLIHFIKLVHWGWRCMQQWTTSAELLNRLFYFLIFWGLDTLKR